MTILLPIDWLGLLVAGRSTGGGGGSSVGSSVIGGLVGGTTVLLGVLAAEALARYRTRRERLESVLFDLDVASSGLMGGPVTGQSTAEVARQFGEVITHLGEIKHVARWPIRHWGEIRDEVDAILVRLAIGIGKAHQGGPVPKLGPIIGDRLSPLILGENKGQRLIDVIDPALRAEGLPTVDEQMADDPDWKPMGDRQDG